MPRQPRNTRKTLPLSRRGRLPHCPSPSGVAQSPELTAPRLEFQEPSQESPQDGQQDVASLASPVSESHAPPTHIVGIGASAGGLEALQHFFANMPAESGLAFIIVQHLSPDFRSMMDELLARHTAMHIHRVTDGMRIAPDSIYLIPPKKEMLIADGRLLLTDKDPAQPVSLPIDLFFRSLAQDMGPRAVGIILSGTGSDGSRGIRSIHDAGGLVMVQSEESASFDGMPRSAIETGVADLVLPPQAMPQAMLTFLQHPVAGPLQTEHPRSDQTAEQGQYGQIFALLLEQYGIDFLYYKPSTVGRRIERRMTMGQLRSLEDYVELLRRDKSELDLLYKDLLIGVTQFFRDERAFAVLAAEVAPRLVELSAAGKELRLWCPGCATGEEVYSLAILLKERAEQQGAPLNLKIFATDMHRDSLNHAASGLYDAPAVEKLGPERLRRFFTRQGTRYRIAPELRRVVVFAEHNVIKDPPFTKVDLISCRNLLIYLQPIVQNKVLSLFHFALKIGGTLFLGPSESLGELYPEFEVIDKHWNIFTKRRDIRLPTQTRFPTGVPLGGRAPQTLTGRAAGFGTEQRQAKAFETLLQKYVPPSMLINERHELVHMFGEAGTFLKHKPGRFELDILTMVEGDLRVALASALQRAGREFKAVVYKGVRVPGKDGPQQVNVLVEPLPDKSTERPFLLVSIEPVTEAPRTQGPLEDGDSFAVAEHAQVRIADLEQEVLNIRENLQATVEELETSNEELQASNEELLASNEELQSTNEELHSVNEELYTVNAEYEKKIRELTQLTNDMDNLLRSTDIGAVFVDRHLQIRRYTPSATVIFNLLPQDEGRPIDHISNNLADKQLVQHIQDVLERGRSSEREVPLRDGRVFLQRILPYLDEKNVVEGAVLTYVDLSDLARLPAGSEPAAPGDELPLPAETSHAS